MARSINMRQGTEENKKMQEEKAETKIQLITEQQLIIEQLNEIIRNQQELLKLVTQGFKSLNPETEEEKPVDNLDEDLAF